MERIKNFSIRLMAFIVLFFAMGHTASAGTLRKPPNNLGLVAYWPFNEGGGSVAGDASGNGHTGTLTGSTLPSWTNGKLGNALSFSAVTPSNRVTFASILTGATNTVSAWIYLTADCENYTYGSIFSENGSTGLYCLNDGINGNKISYYDVGNLTEHFNNTALRPNQWYHIAIVDDAATASHTFYLNGVNDGSFIWADIPYVANTMGSNTFNEILPGKLDEVRLYNRALSASDIYALYKSGAVQVKNSNKSPGTLITGLTAYYTFDGKDMINNVTNLQGGASKNGRLMSFTSTTTTPGKVGQALRFNGTNNYIITTGNSPALSFVGNSAGTISVWVRPRGSGVTTGTLTYQGSPVVASEATFNGFAISRMDIGGEDRIWVAKGGGTEQKIGIPYNVDEWIYVTWAYTGGVLYAYKNGELVGSVASPNPITTTGLFYIGRDWSGDPDYWNGDIDELRTYNRGLSASEIKQLYNLTLGTKVNKSSVNSLTNGLVGYYTFDGGDTNWSTNTITNRGSVGGMATLVSMATTTSPAPGKIGQGLTFNGTSSYVDLGNITSYKPTGNFAVSLWYKGLKGSTEFFVSHSPQILSNFWYVGNSETTFCGTGSCSTLTSKSYTLPNDNAWHHLVAVLNRSPNPDTLTVYIDGVSQGAATGTADGGLGFGSNTRIGGPYWNNSTIYRQGPMDEVRIYNRTLSATEVLQLYRLGK